jgi:hypothetical protein
MSFIPISSLPDKTEYFSINDPRERIGSIAYIGYSRYCNYCVCDIMGVGSGINVLHTMHLREITQYDDLIKEIEKFRKKEESVFTDVISELNHILDSEEA